MTGTMKHVAFDVTPSWWGAAPFATKQLVVAAAGTVLPDRVESSASVFAVGDSVFAYDIPVPEGVSPEHLTSLRGRIVDAIEEVRELLPATYLGLDDEFFG